MVCLPPCLAGTRVAPDDDATKRIDQEFREEQRATTNVCRLLLLGTGNSGKSTLLKQLFEIYGTPMNDRERLLYKSALFTNAVTSLAALIAAAETLDESLGTRLAGDAVECRDAFKRFQSQLAVWDKPARPPGPDIAYVMSRLWADKGIQNAYSNRTKFNLPDSAAYVLDKVYDWVSEDYVPTKQDVVMARIRTTGIVEREFRFQQTTLFKLVDVGGQRNERRKWLHCFSDVGAIIFVVSLSDFELRLEEDSSVNRLHEAITLFSEICNYPSFENIPIILFLNKKDILKQRLAEGANLRTAFPEYVGPSTYDDVVDYIGRALHKVNRDRRKTILTYRTCATDADNVKRVFEALSRVLIERSLQDSGLIV